MILGDTNCWDINSCFMYTHIRKKCTTSYTSRDTSRDAAINTALIWPPSIFTVVH